MDTLRDIRQALRRLAKSPAYTLIVVGTLALGIGANTTIFSFVNSLLLRPLAYHDPGGLVTVNHNYPSVDLVTGISAPGFRDYQNRARSFQSIGIVQGWAPNLTGAGQPERLLGGLASADYLATYGLAPVRGRLFLPEEDVPGGPNVVVISHGFWDRRLGGSEEVIGTPILLDGEPYEIVGVMQPEFEDFFDPTREFWVPVRLEPDAFSDNFRIRESFRAVARLSQGTSVEMASSEMAGLAETIKQELPGTYPPNWTLAVGSLGDRATAGYRSTLLLLVGAVGFVLLITCANVGNMFLARSIGRRKEIAIRRALGSGRWQLIRQLLSESVVLSLLGGAAGLVLADLGIRALVLTGPAYLSRTEIQLDTGVLLFTLIVSLAVGVIFGLGAALHGLRLDMHNSIKDGGQSSRSERSGRTLRHSLVVAEFALALMLLTGAGLMLRSINRISEVDPGFRSDHLLTASMRLPVFKYPDGLERMAFFDRLIPELEALPGVISASTSTQVPFSAGTFTSIFNIEGYVPGPDEPNPWGEIRTVSEDFAETVGLPLIQGRFFERSDDLDATPVIVVDTEMVRQWWPDEDPIGKRITFGDPLSDDSDYFTVVGVVGHMKNLGLDASPRLQLYFPYRQVGANQTTLFIRTTQDPGTVVPAVRSTVFGVDADQPISNVRIMDELIADSIGNRRILTLLLSVFAGLALILATMGIYGVMSYGVRERFREFGIRMTFGADRASLLQMILGQGMVLAGAGIVIGLLGSLALTRVLRSQLYQIGAFDPLTLTLVVALLLTVAAVSILVPAQRAARVDPMNTLRME
jgi:putative ABC transport system permease protein